MGEEEIKKLQNLLAFKEGEIKILKREIENYKKLISYFPGIIVVLDRYGTIEYINEIGAKILGYFSTEELLGKNWFEKCIPENIRDSLKFVFNKIIEGHIEEFEYYENPIETKFKTQKLIGWRNNYIKDTSENVIKVFSYGCEVLKESVKKEKIDDLTKIFEILPEAIHIIDKDYKVVYLNETFIKWNKILGLPVNVIGKNIFEVYTFLSEKVKSEYEKVFTTGDFVITQETNILGDKEIITETRKIPIFEKNKVVYVITFIREITHFLDL